MWIQRRLSTGSDQRGSAGPRPRLLRLGPPKLEDNDEDHGVDGRHQVEVEDKVQAAHQQENEEEKEAVGGAEGDLLLHGAEHARNAKKKSQKHAHSVGELVVAEEGLRLEDLEVLVDVLEVIHEDQHCEEGVGQLEEAEEAAHL